MKINVIDIPEEGLELDFKEEREGLEDLIKNDVNEIELLAPAVYHLFIKREGTVIFIKGGIDTRLGFVCSRCLKRFERDIHWEMFYNLTQGERYVFEKERELEVDELDVSFFDGEVIDTREIFSEQFFLEMPIKPLCMDGCKGLCPRCGADLNKGDCGCSRDRDIDPRLAILKGLKIDNI